LGVDGWVCNNPDGSVSALVVGESEQVDAMIDRLWEGPGAAAVRDVTVEQTESVPQIMGFTITG
jgi:acylphosphatase